MQANRPEPRAGGRTTISAALAASIYARGEAARQYLKTQTQDKHTSRSAALSLSLSPFLSLSLSLSPFLSLRQRSALSMSKKEEGGTTKNFDDTNTSTRTRSDDRKP